MPVISDVRISASTSMAMISSLRRPTHRVPGDSGLTETFVKTRPKLAEQTGGLTANGSAELGDVTVDDAVWLARTD